MADALKIELRLRQNTCIRGESVFFEAVLRNTGQTPVDELVGLEPKNEALVLAIEPKQPQVTSGILVDPAEPQESGTAMSYLERVGKHVHAPDERKRITLKPGQAVSATGDVLKWLGELEPGEYMLTARHPGTFDVLVSEPVKLTVLPADPAALAMPRRGDALPDASMSGAWVHRVDEQFLIFFQEPSMRLPKVMWLGVRVAPAKGVQHLTVADFPEPGIKLGHLFWVDGKTMKLGVVDRDGEHAPIVAEIKPPLNGELLRSPLSMPDGAVVAMIADNKWRKIAVMRADGSGKVMSSPVELGRAASLGPYHCCWEQALRLHFYYCAPGGREVTDTTVFLDDVEGEKPSRQAFVADDPVVWLHGYMDHVAGLAEEPAFEHNTPEEDKGRIRDKPPHRMLWVVERRGNAALVCTRANLTHQRGRAVATFETERAEQWRVVSSVLTAEAHLGLLLASPDGRPFYASTRTGKIQPVSEIAQREITFAQQPVLAAGTALAPLPWVYLRYMDGPGRRINHVLLEPEGERDPEYHGHAH